MLLASSSAFMPSNLARLSAVARSALPRLSRKLRAKPSLTRTTSPIWPSLATRSSRITSIFKSPSVGSQGILGSGSYARRAALAGGAGANVEGCVSQAQERHAEDGPADEHHRGIGAGEREAAMDHATGDGMQHRKAGDRERHQQACRQHAGNDAGQIGQERT